MKEQALAPKYDHKAVEAGRYQEWLDEDVFKPSGDQKAKPYSIVIPPPNVTGKLHMGHAWDTTLQDIVIREKRMQGFDTLWLPGMDHAGIATQAKVEAKLRKEDISRYDLGRDKFVQKVWEWKDEFAKTIHSQWAKMGLSLDYSRERFTLDKGLNEAVRKVFVELYKQGLIYRGEYIVNWDPQARTALSDIEVIHEDDKGAFYHVKYPFADGSGYIEIATTRPETMMGDTAVAVHPGDKRYQDLVGKELSLPLANRKIPIIEDAYVDPAFGTGAVKITPAHDPNDFQVGNRHDLKRINTMNEDGTMNENAGKYNGMDRFEARKAMVADLDKEGLLLKVEPIVHSVGHSERTGVQVEARLSTQWFVKMKPLADAAIKAQQEADKKVTFVPDRFEHTYLQWMENIHDWVISRQLWWGHQIPAWYNKQTGETYVGMEAPKDIENWQQDPDVLDTWFSSALWPFSTMGWPDTDSSDYKRYYPTDTLVTGYDIIPFWVARMIFQGLHFTGERPFKYTLIHGLMRDEQGRKMSKSLGNGIDPMDVIEKYGADALRWFLITGNKPGQDTRFSYKQVEAAWNFINKIWNISRFVMMNLGDLEKPQQPDPSTFDLSDKWLFAQLNETIKQVTDLSERFEFGEMGRTLYNFTWNVFADWYVEMSKEVLYGDDEKAKAAKRVNLAYALDQILRLLHPVMPFVTEKLWLALPHAGQSIVTASYPVANDAFENSAAVDAMDSIIALIRGVRSIRKDAGAPLKTKVDIIVKLTDPALKPIFEDNFDFIDRFVNSKAFTVGTDVAEPKMAGSTVITGATIFVPLNELVDLDEERAKLTKDAKKLQQEIDRIDKKLNNQGFLAKAPEAVVEEQRTKRSNFADQLNSTQQRLAQLQQA
ncbi:valine--tRNA ligase [Lacticaseibacillus paracasei]|uniref:valine--tRNA ligase n=1 Tax=Lacticaseibacillus paracasei TaxID=1597 RepID=UPI00209F2564|nr:valine--tRNA ligase [Lacticaseibacillus paracasei]UVH22690.1 valine--tRNA ligase [Lacticaseibacillus paracasei]